MTVRGLKQNFLYAALFLFVFCVYLSTMYPSFKLNDSPEVTAASLNLCIIHPPGYPLYAVLGKIASLLPAANTAFRINILSAALSIAALFLVLMISRKLLPDEKYGSAAVFINLALTASSYVFWNQAIEAKGGIYMLNLIFILCVVYILISLFEKFSMRFVYLLAFVYGLSLSNHSQTMIILLPVIAAAFFLLRDDLTLRGCFVCAGLFILGLTPYLYIVFRANALSFITWLDSPTINGFVDLITRRKYNNAGENLSAGILLLQIKEYFVLFFKDYGIMCLFIIPGAYSLYKTQKMAFLILSAVLIPVSLAVLFFSRASAHLVGLNDIFLMPVQVISVLFITAGLLFIFRAVKGGLLRSVFTAVTAALFAVSTAVNYIANNSSGNFLGYDTGMNLMKTMEDDSLFFAEGDYNIMPFAYLYGNCKKRNDILFICVPDLALASGLKAVDKRLSMNMTPDRIDKNAGIIIDKFIGFRHIYRTSPSELFEKMDTGRHLHLPDGVLIRITDKDEVISSGIFETYSYRGIREYFNSSPDIFLPISWYFWSMYNQAGVLGKQGMYTQAVKLYNKALLFPGDVPRNDIYYAISNIYRRTGDTNNELINLKLTLKSDPSYTAAYGRLGLLMLSNGDMTGAKDIAVRSELKGLRDADSLKLIKIMKNGGS
jgi:hypothetical protein